MKSPANKIFPVFVVVLSFMGVPQVSAAEADVSGDELKTLLSGNTIEGKYIKWKTTHKMYFEASGKMRRIDSRNNKEQGHWFIGDEGNLCINVRKKRCNEVKRQDDGSYHAYRGDKLRFTIDKIEPGNPYKL